jgi:GNAT superfamily N-acetyltransferase
VRSTWTIRRPCDAGCKPPNAGNLDQWSSIRPTAKTVSIHEFLALESEWARGITREIVARSIEHSLCFGVFHRNRQVGFARVITDCATIAYLGDVFVLKDYRGRGLAKWLMECVVAHPALQGLRRWILVTADAHDLYRKYGFTPLARPERFMELHDAEI